MRLTAENRHAVKSQTSLDIALASRVKYQTGSPAPAAESVFSRHPALSAAASGILYVLCFPHADLGFLAWVALVPFFLTFPHARMRVAVWCGLVLGFIQTVGIAYWMGVFAAHKIGAAMGVVAVALAGGIHAPLFALIAAATQLAWQARPGARLFAVPAAWAICEWLGELGTFGMGWGDLGYSQWRNIPVLQIASLGGVFAISYLIVLVNVALASRRLSELRIGALVLIAALAWGSYASRPTPHVPMLRVAAIQGDINQDVPWSFDGRPVDESYFYGALAAFDQLLSQAAHRGARFAAIPETAIPGYIQFDAELRRRVDNWAASNRMAVLAGGRYLDETSGKEENVVFMISPTLGETGFYAKSKLVPFGEYVPYRPVFRFLKELEVSVVDMGAGGSDQPPLFSGIAAKSAGEEASKLSDNSLVVGPMICFESTYSRFARRQVAMGATLLTVVTDDTWFGRTAAAQQHLEMSAMRAAETRRSLVRSAATGISAIFDSRGKMISQLVWYKKGIAVADVPIETTVTPYVRFGNLLIALFAALWLAAAASSVRLKQSVR